MQLQTKRRIILSGWSRRSTAFREVEREEEMTSQHFASPLSLSHTHSHTLTRTHTHTHMYTCTHTRTRTQELQSKTSCLSTMRLLSFATRVCLDARPSFANGLKGQSCEVVIPWPQTRYNSLPSNPQPHTNTDKQADRQTGRQADRQTGRQADRLADAYPQTHAHAHMQTHTHANPHIHTHPF